MVFRIDDAALVLDANVLIDGCCAVAAGLDVDGDWWQPQPDRRRQALALREALAAELDPTVAVFFDAELESTVLRKLTQPVVAERPEDRGLGWSLDDAVDAYRNLIQPVHRAGRACLIEPSAPPDFLDPSIGYEDNRIWGLAMAAQAHDPIADLFLVTRDQQFRELANKSARRLHSGRPEWVAAPPQAMAKILGYHRRRTPQPAPPAG